MTDPHVFSSAPLRGRVNEYREHPDGHFNSADKIALLFTILISVHSGQGNLLETER